MGSGSRSSKRKKKRSQKHSKKSRGDREKSKKKQRRHRDSSSDEGVASTSSLSSPSCSSDNVYRSKKRARSPSRKDRKSLKKRIKRGRSISGESSEESPHVKRRRKSKSSRDSNKKNKKLKKKRRRKPSVSSQSSLSRSCSESESSDNSRRDVERNKKKLETKKRKERELSRERSVSKSRRSSKSSSPNGFRSHMDHSEARMEEYQPRRLKSVIVAEIEREEHKVEQLNRDGHKDEIVYEHYDYPSKSDDSFDGLSERDAVAYLDDVDKETRFMEDPKREIVAPDIRDPELHGIQSSLGGERTIEVISSSVGSGSDTDNLETILRKKALENLLKRQGKMVSSSLQNESVSEKSELEGSVRSMSKAKENVDLDHADNETNTLKDNDAHPASTKLETFHSVEKGNIYGDHVINKPKPGSSTSTRRLVGSSNTWRRELNPQKSFQSSQLSPKETESVEGIHASGTKVVSGKVDHATTSEPNPERKSTKVETNVEDEDSQFEQKTMTVMRGGELVQVSYKVRIPKKAPALARRQLQR